MSADIGYTRKHITLNIIYDKHERPLYVFSLRTLQHPLSAYTHFASMCFVCRTLYDVDLFFSHFRCRTEIAPIHRENTEKLLFKWPFQFNCLQQNRLVIWFDQRPVGSMTKNKNSVRFGFRIPATHLWNDCTQDSTGEKCVRCISGWFLAVCIIQRCNCDDSVADGVDRSFECFTIARGQFIFHTRNVRILRSATKVLIIVNSQLYITSRECSALVGSVAIFST